MDTNDENKLSNSSPKKVNSAYNNVTIPEILKQLKQISDVSIWYVKIETNFPFKLNRFITNKHRGQSIQNEHENK